MSGPSRHQEVQDKVSCVQRAIGEGGTARLRGIDWFAWITAGGSSAVLLTAETGIAEVLVTPQGACVVTDEIEAARLMDEELPVGFPVRPIPWAYHEAREALVRELTQGCRVFSDRPVPGEDPLPEELLHARWSLLPVEQERYREVGRQAALAMTEVLNLARPEWSELDLAGAGAQALLRRGLEPGLVMAAGERRLELYRHPMPTSAPLGRQAMLVFCARGFGLWANLTRFVSFGALPAASLERHRLVQQVEARALELSRPGTRLRTVYGELAKGYAALGHPEAIREHHQGGSTGYLSREVIATPDSCATLAVGSAVAWNPSLVGAKVEDTLLITESGLENLTLDPAWPTAPVAGTPRPQVLER
ncbi:hypothetical protein GMLC_17600 [Geomonas limicola]|uniref:Peptidase M24 domain-containing protein n=1 Tax=Geomonas limicola TaxID=2740186 RepID=A0A6V8N6S6_9BACT|nr:M24 family metallopeptidase [Geomonas limicola]GFO68181.1 hypothetical protein GMLC_17600 [Geomonas limicola]